MLHIRLTLLFSRATQNAAAAYCCWPYLFKLPRVTLNDVSDGLASELNEIAEASRVTLEIEADQLPKHPHLPLLHKEWLEWVLFGGEDFVLTGTIPETDWKRFETQCKKEHIQVTRIGQVKDDRASSVILKDHDQQTILMKKDIIILRNEVTPP